MGKTKLKVYQIDAWRDIEGGWTYNNSIPIFKIEIDGEPTSRKILKALRDKEVISPKSLYRVDNYLDYEGIWTVQSKNTYEPLFDVKIETE